MVFSDVEMKLDTNAGGFVKVAYPKGIKRPNTKNYVNLPVFLHVWHAMKTDTNWKFLGLHGVHPTAPSGNREK